MSTLTLVSITLVAAVTLAVCLTLIILYRQITRREEKLKRVIEAAVLASQKLDGAATSNGAPNEEFSNFYEAYHTLRNAEHAFYPWRHPGYVIDSLYGLYDYVDKRRDAYIETIRPLLRLLASLINADVSAFLETWTNVYMQAHRPHTVYELLEDAQQYSAVRGNRGLALLVTFARNEYDALASRMLGTLMNEVYDPRRDVSCFETTVSTLELLYSIEFVSQKELATCLQAIRTEVLEYEKTTKAILDRSTKSTDQEHRRKLTEELDHTQELRLKIDSLLNTEVVKPDEAEICEE